MQTMKKNLKEYSKKFNPILETNIFSLKECERIVSILVKQQDQWENRSPAGNFFMSYGALTYLDAQSGVANDPEYDKFKKNHDSTQFGYTAKAKYFNEMLAKNFGWMYAKIKMYYVERFEKKVVFKGALPGFHIFQTAEQLNHDYVKNLATIHVDKPFTCHEWGSDLVSASSFTIAVKLPKCGAGLNIWLDDSIFDNINTVYYHNMSKEEQLSVSKEAKYLPYKLGHMYEQTGFTRHQITLAGDAEKGERRITVQGHLVETTNEIIIYV